MKRDMGCGQIEVVVVCIEVDTGGLGYLQLPGKLLTRFSNCVDNLETFLETTPNIPFIAVPRLISLQQTESIFLSIPNATTLIRNSFSRCQRPITLQQSSILHVSRLYKLNPAPRSPLLRANSPTGQ
jgi:hypothetical protein